jgi:hypothetical protein
MLLLELLLLMLVLVLVVLVLLVVLLLLVVEQQLELLELQLEPVQVMLMLSYKVHNCHSRILLFLLTKRQTTKQSIPPPLSTQLPLLQLPPLHLQHLKAAPLVRLLSIDRHRLQMPSAILSLLPSALQL